MGFLKFSASFLLFLIEKCADMKGTSLAREDEYNIVKETFTVLDHTRVRSHRCYGDKSKCLNSLLHPDNTRQLQKIHRCKMDYLYTLYFSDGKKTTLTREHPLITESYGVFTLKLYGIDKIVRIPGGTIDVSHMNIYIKNIEDSSSRLDFVEKSYFPMMTYDVTVSCDRLYFSDGLLNHNCVTSETMVDVRHDGVEKAVPIVDLFYGNKKKMTFLDKVIFFLFRLRRKIVS